MSLTTNPYLDTALRAAHAAGAIHKKYFNTAVRVTTKSSSFDLLTTADLEAEKTIVRIVRKQFPDHNILAEEHRYKKTRSDYRWIIDPLDGTNNFVCGMPIFCASVALAKDNEVVVGAIYDAIREELFWAQKGKGAYRNGKPIKVSDARTLKQSLLITGFYYDRGKKMRKNLNYIHTFLIKRILGLRRFGAAALDLCHVACGRASGYWELKLNSWDFAAGALIVQEAGGKVTDEKNRTLSLAPSFIVASNGNIHNQMLGIISNKNYNDVIH